MKVFKFGGASVKDAKSIKNLVSVLKTIGYEDTLIVVSAMGKTTNALEEVLNAYFNSKEELQSTIQAIVKYHNQILLELFDDEKDAVFNSISAFFDELKQFLSTNKSPDYSFVYDQVVCYGELISTKIISAYLDKEALTNTWVDARECIKTDNFYRRANVNWEHTQAQINTRIKKHLLHITQGFIGSDSNNFSSTLGREGSDYSAAIFAYCLNAEQLTIWKDVPGVLSADPRFFENSQLLNKISYEEAIELAFYGASVIHPKTLQPLQRKEIPLYVKSFFNPTKSGTCISKGVAMDPKTPCFILKQNQHLLVLSSLNFSYIVEDNISHIFNLLSTYKIKVGVIQNSAISFSVCIEDVYANISTLIQELKPNFKIQHFTNVSLYTIRHYTDKAVAQLEKEKTVLLKQLTPSTLQLVTQ